MVVSFVSCTESYQSKFDRASDSFMMANECYKMSGQEVFVKKMELYEDSALYWYVKMYGKPPEEEKIQMLGSCNCQSK